MATYTPNLNLKKPGSDDFVDIADINRNMDKIDTAVGPLAGDISTHTGNSTIHVTSTDKTNWNGKIDKSLITAAGDLIYGAADNTPAKLAKGTDGQVLKLASGLPSWGDELWVKISDTTLSTESRLIALTIPTGYTQLKLIMFVGHSSGSNVDDISLNFNDDTGTSKYKWSQNYEASTNVWTRTGTILDTKITIKLAAPASGQGFGFHEIDIANPPLRYKTVKNVGGSVAYASNGILSGEWRNNTNEISKISIWLANYSFITGSRFLLLGMR